MAASAYLHAIQMPTGHLRTAKQGQAVTSLVPPDAGLYKTYMQRGEDAMHDGNFAEAFAMFQMANDIEGKDPDSLVSLVHATFALAKQSYYRSAYYLQKAVRYLPELPLRTILRAHRGTQPANSYWPIFSGSGANMPRRRRACSVPAARRPTRT